MIRSFKSREAERLFHRFHSKRFLPDIQRAALRRLRMLNQATTLRDLRGPPSNRLERLKGEREGQHSIRIDDQWRICFRWDQGDALEVEIVDDR